MYKFLYQKKLGLLSSGFFFIFIVAFSFIRWSSTESFLETEFEEKNLSFTDSSPTSLSLEQQLLNLMALLVDAHKSLAEQNQDQFLVHIQSISNQISKIDVNQEESIPYHKKLYLYRQLQNIKEDIQWITLRNISQNQKMKSLKEAYKELILISESYALDPKSQKDEWSVYFCSKNSSLWVQNSNLKKHNPFGQGYQNCGHRIQ